MKKYKNLSDTRKIRLSKVNAARIEELMEEFKLDNINQMVNWCIDQADDFFKIKMVLKKEGMFILNEKTAKQFGISL